MNTTTVREPIRPIYGPSDIRWDELAAWFEINADNVHAEFDELQPVERARWHATYVLGLDGLVAQRVPVDYPSFPSVPQGPSWATKSEDYGIDPDTDFPMWVWYRDLTEGEAMAAAIQLVAKCDPEAKVVLWGAPELFVWVDGDTQIRFESPDKAWQLRSVLHNAAHALEQALGESR